MRARRTARSRADPCRSGFRSFASQPWRQPVAKVADFLQADRMRHRVGVPVDRETELAQQRLALFAGAEGHHRVLGAVAHEHRLRRSEEHTSALQSLMRISYAVFCLKKKITKIHNKINR